MQPRHGQQASQAWRHTDEHQPTTGPSSPAMSADEHAQTGRIRDVELGDIDEEVATPRFDRVRESEPDISHIRDVDPADEVQTVVSGVDPHAVTVGAEVN